MQRDMRLTGTLRGQTDKPIAPFGFELNSKWRVCLFWKCDTQSDMGYR